MLILKYKKQCIQKKKDIFRSATANIGQHLYSYIFLKELKLNWLLKTLYKLQNLCIQKNGIFRRTRVEVWLPWSIIILTKGCRLYYVMSKCWFDCSKFCMFQGCKKPMLYMGPPYSSPWVCRAQLWTLLEKVVDLRAL